MEQVCSTRVETLLKRETERQQDILKKKTEKKSSCAENEQYSYFNNVFDEKCREIENMIESAPMSNKNEIISQFDKMSKELNSIKKFMSESLIFLRGYDIRVCNEHLQELELKIKKTEENLMPKKKFGFKNKKTPKESVDVVDSSNGVKKSIIYNDFYGFKNLEDQNLTLDNASIFKKDVTLHNLTNCTVFLPGSPSTLQMNSLLNCTIICGPVCTSIFAENCIDCKFIIACQQLRLHSSLKCFIYLHVTSKAIIEDCKGIKVAPYNLLYDSLEIDFKKAGIDPCINHWDSLDDFNWLVADKQSPNWSVLEETERVEGWASIVSQFVSDV